MLHKIFTNLSLLLLTMIMVFGFWFSIMMMHTSHTMTNCPFMPGEMVLCSMTISDHLRAWQIKFATTFSFVLVLGILGSSILLSRFLLLLEKYIHTRYKFIIRWRSFIFIPLYQNLFSRGLLNSRIP